MNTDITVILCSFNGEVFIAEQIRSILNQQNVNVSLQVFDDGSTDSTIEIVESFAAVCSAVVLTRNAESPVKSPAHNFLRSCLKVEQQSAYFALSDQDDVWEPDRLCRAIGTMTESGSGAYSSDLQPFSDSSAVEFKRIRKSSDQKTLDYLFQGASAGCTYVFSADSFRLLCSSLGRSQEPIGKFSHDWLFYAVCRSWGVNWFFDERASVRYRIHQGNNYHQPTWFGRARHKLSLLKNGWYRNQILLLEPFLAGSSAEKDVLKLVRNLTPWDRIRLAANVRSYRRRTSEQLALLFSLVLGVIAK